MGEASKIRNYLTDQYSEWFGKGAQLIHGLPNMIDIGCGDDPIFKWAHTMDKRKEVSPSVQIDATKALNMGSNWDVVFSSHTLEDIQNYKSALKKWISWIAPNGLLVLFLPHKYFYPNVGHPLANKAHKHDFLPGDIIPVIEKQGMLLVECRCFFPDDHVYRYEERGRLNYSFLIVAQRINVKEYPKIIKGKHS